MLTLHAVLACWRIRARTLVRDRRNMTTDTRAPIAQRTPAGLLDESLRVFIDQRPRLFGIAYRMLGSASEAEDVVQETWVRWQRCDRTAVREPGAFLATTTTRLAINVIQSARSRRETTFETWMPEPVDTSNDPTLGAERAEAIEFATLLLMERLTPLERAAYVLREAFDYPYPRIAEIIDTSNAAARQLVRRARTHLSTERVRGPGGESHRRFLGAFLRAARTGETHALEVVLAGDAAAGRPVPGSRKDHSV